MDRSASPRNARRASAAATAAAVLLLLCAIGLGLRGGAPSVADRIGGLRRLRRLAGSSRLHRVAEQEFLDDAVQQMTVGTPENAAGTTGAESGYNSFALDDQLANGGNVGAATDDAAETPQDDDGGNAAPTGTDDAAGGTDDRAAGDGTDDAGAGGTDDAEAGTDDRGAGTDDAAPAHDDVTTTPEDDNFGKTTGHEDTQPPQAQDDATGGTDDAGAADDAAGGGTDDGGSGYTPPTDDDAGTADDHHIINKWTQGHKTPSMSDLEDQGMAVAKDPNVWIAAVVLSVTGFFFMLFVVHQLVENPHGCVARLFRCLVAFFRIACWPCRRLCCCCCPGGQGGRPRGRGGRAGVPLSGDDDDDGYGRDLELT